MSRNRTGHSSARSSLVSLMPRRYYHDFYVLHPPFDSWRALSGALIFRTNQLSAGRGTMALGSIMLQLIADQEIDQHVSNVPEFFAEVFEFLSLGTVTVREIAMEKAGGVWGPPLVRTGLTSRPPVLRPCGCCFRPTRKSYSYSRRRMSLRRKSPAPGWQFWKSEIPGTHLPTRIYRLLTIADIWRTSPNHRGRTPRDQQARVTGRAPLRPLL